MTRTAIRLLIVFWLPFSSAAWLPAQSLSADRFLDGLSSHPVGEQLELQQTGEIYQALIVAPASEVERVVPAVLRYARPGNQANVRAHALGFLLAITARPDGADLLSSKSEEISSLLSDVDPNIQTSIAGTIEILMMQPATNTKPYVVALTAAIQDRRTPQDVIVERMIPPLLTYGRDDPRVAAAALAFVHRGDLTASTRSALVNTLSSVPDLPEGVNRYLVERLDDSDPHVRGVAVVAYPDSTTAYHAAAKGRVERMATDPREDPRVRELAKEAIEGKTSSNPNIDLPPYTQHDR